MPKDFFRLHGLGEPRSRRRFLAQVSFGLGGVMGLMLGVPLIGYLFGPLIKRSPQQWIDLGPVSDFALGQTKLVSFTDPSSVPWAGQTSQTSVWVRQTAPNAFDVFAVNCTHLGCPVNWLDGARLFECPCHGGIYYSDGTVAAGPPPRSLFKHETRIVDGRLQAFTIPLPTSQLSEYVGNA